ncbi:Phosphatidylinositol 4-kinase pik1alpha (PI4-kinase)(PtdIns-4-kinase) [Sorochytrium milnesiophthora]
MQDAFTEDSFGAQNSWLLRFFKSEFFNEWMAVYYLFKYPDSVGIQHYLCNEMKKFPLAVMEEFLPQFAHMLVVRPDLVALEAFIVDRCQYSSHFALLTLWYFHSYLVDLMEHPQSASFKLCRRIVDEVQSVVARKDPEEDEALAAAATATADDESAAAAKKGSATPVARQTIASALVSLGCMLAGPGAPGLATAAGRLAIEHGTLSSSVADESFVDMDADATERSPSLDGASSKKSLDSGRAPDDPRTQHRRSLDSSDAHRKATVSALQADQARRPNSVSLSSNPHFSMTSASPSLEDLHKGKAFSFAQFISKAASSTGLGKTANTSTTSSRTTSDADRSAVSTPPRVPLITNADVSARSLGIGSGKSFESILDSDPKLLDQYYFHAELQFMNTVVDIAERLVAVPRGSRQSTLTAELTLLNHNLPAPVCIPLWCPAVGNNTFHHQVVRISPNDAVVLNSADRAPYLVFIEVLENECGFKMLKSESRQPLEKSLAKSALSDDQVSPERPSVETRRLADNETIANGLSIGAGNAYVPPNNPVSILPADRAVPPKKRGSLTAFTNLMQPATSVSPSPPPVPMLAQLGAELKQPSLASITSGLTPDTRDDKFADQMRTAAIMLAQLALQEQNQLAAQATQGARSPPGRKKRKPQGNNTDEIRNRIIREMMALDEKRMRLLQEAPPHATPSASPVDEAATAKPEVPRAPSEGDNGDVKDAGASVDTTTDNAVKGVADHAAAAPADTGKSSNSEKRRTSGPLPRATVDKEDPSGAVFRETWTKKLSRIRQSSPYGKHANWRLLSVVVKSGADLRQEQLACQIVREMGRVWAEAGVPCWVYNYRVLVTGSGCGLIETVRNSISIHSLKKEAYSRNQHIENFTYTLNDYFLNEFGGADSERYKAAQANFMHSLAAYSIISYVLNLKDRHNGNILLDYTSGHLIHIDFGFMFSNSPGAVGFETAPFKLPLEYLEVLDGYGSDMYNQWKALLVQGFLALRKSHERIVGLVEIMEKDSPLDCFKYSSLKAATASNAKAGGSISKGSNGRAQAKGASQAAAQQTYLVSSALRERFLLSLTDTQVEDYVEKLVASSMGNVFTRLYDSFQYYTQGVMA